MFSAIQLNHIDPQAARYQPVVQDSLFLNACATCLTLMRQTSHTTKSLPRTLGIFAHRCYRCVVQKGSCKIHLLQMSAQHILPSQNNSIILKIQVFQDKRYNHTPYTAHMLPIARCIFQNIQVFEGSPFIHTFAHYLTVSPKIQVFTETIFRAVLHIVRNHPTINFFHSASLRIYMSCLF